MAAPIYASALWTFDDVHNLNASTFPRVRDSLTPSGLHATPWGPSTGGPHYAWCYAYRVPDPMASQFAYAPGNAMAPGSVSAMQFKGQFEYNKLNCLTMLTWPGGQSGKTQPQPLPYQSPYGFVQEDFDTGYTLGAWISADPCEYYKSWYDQNSTKWCPVDPMVIMSTAMYSGFVGAGNPNDNATWDWYRDRDGWLLWDVESTGQLSLQQRFHYSPGGGDPNTYEKKEYITTVNSVISPNTPTHIALRYNRGVVDMFVNGVKVAVTKASDTDANYMALTSADTLGIAQGFLPFALGGGTPEKHQHVFAGYMDEAFAVGGIYPDAKIMDIYLNGFPEPTTVALLLLGAPMIARWRRRK